MNPYLAGVMLGMVLLLAMYLSGRGLAASGGIKCVWSHWLATSERHASCLLITASTLRRSKPLKNWLPSKCSAYLPGFIQGLSRPVEIQD
jgi:hypothetical protein